jgi:hypothetical protein
VPQGEQSNGTVHRAGIHIDESQAASYLLRDRTFSGTCRTVNGYDHKRDFISC